MAVPYIFATATSSIPLSQLDSNFSTPITLGNTSIQLGNTVTTLNNMTLANVTVSSVASTFPNNYLANSTATLGNATITLGGTTSTVGNLTLTNATISSGTYSVTDATVSGNLTLSGGTANGVAYLNGSKVLTTGSALVFDGSNLGIGTSSPSRKLDVSGTPSSIGGAGTGVLVSVINTGTAYNASPTSAISLWNKFNSGGSAFPSAVLQAGKENATDGNYAGYMSFITIDASANPNERMRLDSSGNLGLGVTPSAWSSSFKALNIGANGQSVSADGGQIIIGSNYVQESGGARYVVSAAAGSYAISRNSHAWYIAPSGTAGNTITWTQAMTLDASGNLGIGTTSPSQALTVNGAVGYNAPVTVTGATYSVLTTDNWIIANRAGTVTLTLPTASSFTGRILTVKNVQAQTVVSNASNVVPIGSTTAGTAILTSTAGKFATLVSDGTNWIIMQAN